MLKLIIGGRNSGKHSHVIQMGYAASDFGADFGKPVLYKLNDLVKQLLNEEKSPLQYIKQQLETIEDIVIVCDEVGCGVVPIDKGERIYREEVGRVCIEIASRAHEVERVYCGIATKIK